MEANDDEGANGNIRHKRKSDAIENLASVKDAEEESNICRIEYDDMQHVLVREESIQVPSEKKDTGRETKDTKDGVTFQSIVSKQMILSKEIANIIIW
jgi:hypothetical protein